MDRRSTEDKAELLLRMRKKKEALLRQEAELRRVSNHRTEQTDEEARKKQKINDHEIVLGNGGNMQTENEASKNQSNPAEETSSGSCSQQVTTIPNKGQKGPQKESELDGRAGISDSISKSFELIMETVLKQSDDLVTSAITNRDEKEGHILKLLESTKEIPNAVDELKQRVAKVDNTTSALVKTNEKIKTKVESLSMAHDDLKQNVSDIEKALSENTKEAEISEKTKSDIINTALAKLKEEKVQNDANGLKTVTDESLKKENKVLEKKIEELENTIIKIQKKSSKRKADIKNIVSYLETLTNRLDAIENSK